MARGLVLAAVVGSTLWASAPSGAGPTDPSAGQPSKVFLKPKRIKGPIHKVPPKVSEEFLRKLVEARNREEEEHHERSEVRIHPMARPEDVVPGPAALVHAAPVPAIGPAAPRTGADQAIGPRAPGDFIVYRDTLLNDTFTGDWADSIAGEPSLGADGRMVFYSGNWYATVSGDYGQTFTYISPFDTFPQPGYCATEPGGLNCFCCDQVVYYERTRGLMFWYLQYNGDDVGRDIVRLAVARSQEDLANNTWTVYEFNAATLGYGEAGLDFPDLATSANYLYVTTNISGVAADLAVALRLSLDELAAGGTVAIDGQFGSDTQTLRPTQGASTTMYFGTILDSRTIQIYSWPEANALPTLLTRLVDGWFMGTSYAPSPDGTNWTAYDPHWMLASWVGGNQVGFMWGSSQGGAFPWPNVRFARFNTAGLTLANQGQIWHSDFGIAYPSAHPNDRGDVGGTIALGGGGSTLPYPAVAAWIADGFNGDALQPLEMNVVAIGNLGPTWDPPDNRWGDYFTTRRHVPYGMTWMGTGFVNNVAEPGATKAQPHLIWFGRAADQPLATPIVINSSNTTLYQDGTLGHPYDTVHRGHFAAVPGDSLFIYPGSYPGPVTLSTPVTIGTPGGPVTIGQ